MGCTIYHCYLFSIAIISLSPAFYLANTQISKAWGNKFEVYLGAENLFNYKQANPILANEDPFSDYFDSSLIWGPVFGRKIYMGLRFRIL